MNSLVVSITLQCKVGYLEVAFDLSDVTTFIGNDGWSVQVNLVVNYKQWVISVHNIVID